MNDQNRSGSEVVNICIAGDYCPAQGKQDQQRRKHPASIDWGTDANLFEKSDYILVNLECPITTRDEPIRKTGPALKTNPEQADIFTTYGVNVVSLANNHIMDMGRNGLQDTLNFCKANGVQTFGAGENAAEASRPLILRHGNITLGLIAIAENEFSASSEDKAGVNPLDLVNNYYQIVKLKKEVDIVLVIYHGGNEHYPLPSPRMRKTLRCFVDWGADAVFSHHAHMVSGMEIYHDAPIFYGLGNFIFDSKKPKHDDWYIGMMIFLKVSKTGINGYEIFPFLQSHGNKTVEMLQGESKNHFMVDFKNLSEIITNDLALTAKWDAFCQEKKKFYLGNFFGFNRIERMLHKRFSIWPFWKVKAKNLLVTRNYVNCEAHHDVLISALNSESEKTR
jgi:poly-gamma-glutamate capsule biosynthesis protein CapA/YwtB (metallophosphatase superfamily)